MRKLMILYQYLIPCRKDFTIKSSLLFCFCAVHQDSLKMSDSSLTYSPETNVLFLLSFYTEFYGQKITKQKMNNHITTIAFDADDTLWINEPYFSGSRKEFCVLLEDYLPQHSVSQELFKTEMQNLHLYGYGVKRIYAVYD